MSSSRPAERGYHQDYIARIRYENALPPPPGAPKFLDIPIEGLSYYTSAAFASRLVKQQPLNIEADAELGMPIDLVGIPGVFHGDESAIQMPLDPPAQYHPKDRALLRPLAELGKPKFSTTGHSFLRRTEYISSEAKARAEAFNTTPRTSNKTTAAAANARQAKKDEVDDPIAIMREVVKGFDLAYPEDKYVGPDDGDHLQGATPTVTEVEAWNNPKHPSRPDVTLVDSFPILPDLEALTEGGSYIVAKYSGNLTGVLDGHLRQLDTALLQPVEKAAGQNTAGEEYEYDLYLPPEEDVTSLKRKWRETVDQDDISQVDDQTVIFSRLRTFDQTLQTQELSNHYENVALVLHDPNSRVDEDSAENEADNEVSGKKRQLPKAAYYYPISMKLQLKPKRKQNLTNMGLRQQDGDEDTQRADQIVLTLRQSDQEELDRRALHRAELMLNDSSQPESKVNGD